MPNAKKTEIKAAKVTASKKVVSKKATAPKKDVGNGVAVYSLAGVASTAKLELPKEVFGAEVNKALLAQATRVYTNNQQAHYANTKTRGEVEGSTKKIMKQKGTGGARHGARRAPIFVGGGIALGPKARKVELELPKKMKKAALISALSLKAKEQKIVGIAGLDKATGKTKEMAQLFKKTGFKSALVVTDAKLEKALQAVRNLPGVSLKDANNLNVLEVLKHQNLLLTQEAVAKLTEKLSKKEIK